ncbi:XRE family transcriptional regulator [Roseovarius sp.]|jgi:transcriptional regulator with XRE-family HTH domain
MSDTSKKPYQDTELAKYVERRVLELKSKKTQAEIASEAGYRNANMVSMVKSGASKLALDRVPSMARALECDPAYLMRLALEQAVGRTAAAAVIEIFGEPVTENELGWIKAIRRAILQ